MRVRFRTGGEPPQYTPYQDCEAGLIRNFYVHSARKCGSRRMFMGTWRGPTAVQWQLQLRLGSYPATEGLAQPRDRPKWCLPARLASSWKTRKRHIVASGCRVCMNS